MRRLLLPLALVAASAATAETPAPEPMQAPPPPPMPENMEIGDQDYYEPEVTIRREREKTVTEYRVNGRLYMIKVQPASGPAYYLSDTDGDGNLETQQEELDPGFLVPRWILFSW